MGLGGIFLVSINDVFANPETTGSVSFDRTVYPVPWGTPDDFLLRESLPAGRSIFPIHSTGISGIIDEQSEFLPQGDVIVYIRVNDPDFNLSPTKIDSIAQDLSDEPGVGPIKIGMSRGIDKIVLGYAGGTASNIGKIDTFPLADVQQEKAKIRQLGPMKETHPDSGIFELKLPLKYTDGPTDSRCPLSTFFDEPFGNKKVTADKRFDDVREVKTRNCILQGDTITVEYTDPVSRSGEPIVVTDSARFDLRNGVTQSDKSVYIIDRNMIITLIDPDFDLDVNVADTINLDVIEWSTDAATLTIGERGGEISSFNPEPQYLKETGDSTGFFQVAIKIPSSLNGINIVRGELISLKYTDWGPSGADFVGQKSEDIELVIAVSNFGATIELDQKAYTWTDKVYITIIAPDYNSDPELVDNIGETSKDPIIVSTRESHLKNYKLTETGTDTGIFTGEVILTGFCHNADGKSNTGSTGTAREKCPQGDDTNPRTEGEGPTNGFLESYDDDEFSVSFEFYDEETVTGSSLIRWNIGKVQWLDSSYPSSGTGIIRVIDPDMNLDPENFDSFRITVLSESDPKGIGFIVHETNEATGIFEAPIRFSEEGKFYSNGLKVSEGDTIVAKYIDRTLPTPSYELGDTLEVIGTALIDIPQPILSDNTESFSFLISAGTDFIPITAGEEEDVIVTIYKKSGITKALEVECSVSPRDSLGCKVSSSIVEPDPKIDVKVTVDTSDSTESGEYKVDITATTIDEQISQTNSDSFVIFVEAQTKTVTVPPPTQNGKSTDKQTLPPSTSTSIQDAFFTFILPIISILSSIAGLFVFFKYIRKVINYFKKRVTQLNN